MTIATVSLYSEKMESVPLLLSLLILCVCGPPLCGATDYYVRPTEPTNASCPGQPCLTLHHYIQNLSSNANYHLLPGVHFINGPITLKNARNVSMAAFRSNSSSPKIVATIDCHCITRPCYECTGISFVNASNISISSLSIDVQLLLPSHEGLLSVTGIGFTNSNGVVIRGLYVWITKMREEIFVLAVSHCRNIEISELTTHNNGIDVTLSNNVNISN